MKIHEFQAKELFRAAGVDVLRGIPCTTPQEAAAAFTALGGPLAVIKAQIHAGGRGKGTIVGNPSQRGVQLVRSPEEAQAAATAMLGHPLATKQTGPSGQTVRKVFLEAGCDISRELYLAILVDRGAGGPIVIGSQDGGMDIEQVAADTPERIFHVPFDPHAGLTQEQASEIGRRLGLEGAALLAAGKFLPALCKLFVDKDCSLVEINPLVVTKGGQLVALDAKVAFDDNALFRHAELKELRDIEEEEPMEVRAQEKGLSYVKLDGSIGCLVNGAGLAMATMDIIKYHGGFPANFLDVGGGANVDQVTEAFRILLSDKNVKAVLVNIFGGIMSCKTIATAILAAYQNVGFSVPLVVRLEGTEVAEGKKILAESGIPILAADGLTDAAKKVVAAAQAA